MDKKRQKFQMIQRSLESIEDGVINLSEQLGKRVTKSKRKPLSKLTIEHQEYQMLEQGLSAIGQALKDIKIEKPKDGYTPRKGVDYFDGRDGITPKKGVDYFTDEEQASFVSQIMSLIRVPKDGNDADPVDYTKIEAFIASEVAKIPRPEVATNESVDEDSIIQQVLSSIPPVVVDYPTILNFCKDEIERIENNREVRWRQLNSGGPTTRLGELVDVDTTNLATGNVLSWNGQKWVPASDSVGARSFTQLNDVPNSYTGQGGKIVAVKSDLSGLEFIANPEGSDVDSVSNSDGSLTISPTTGTVVISAGNISPFVNDAGYITGATDSTLTETGNTLGINLANNNIWTGQQDFRNDSIWLRRDKSLSFEDAELIKFGASETNNPLTLSWDFANARFKLADIGSVIQTLQANISGATSVSATSVTGDTLYGTTADINNNVFGPRIYLATSSYAADALGNINTNSDYYINGSPIGVSHWSNDAGYLSGTVPISSGGTGATSFGANRIPYMNSGNTAMTSTANFAHATNTSKIFIGNETTTTNKVLTLRGMASQSGNLLELQNSAGTQLTFFDSAGNFNFQTTSNSTTGVIFKNSARFIHTFGSGNLFVGTSAGNFSLSGAVNNVGIGESALDALTDGDYNTGVGFNVLGAVTSGFNNNAIGNSALATITSGNNNNAMGNAALLNLATSASGNTGVGSGAGRGITSATDLTFIGKWAGYPNDANGAVLSGLSNSTAIGANANVHISNAVVLGSSGENSSTAVQFGGIGTASPSAMWHVVNATAANAGLIVQGATSQSGDYLTVRNSASVKQYWIASTGAMGFGSGALAGLENSNLAPYLDVSFGGSPASIVMGAELNNVTRTNNTTKTGKFAGAPYTTTDKGIAIIQYNSTASANTLYFGGGTSILQASTSQQFYTASAVNTVTGTQRLAIFGSGRIAMGDGLVEAYTARLAVIHTATTTDSTLELRAMAAQSGNLISGNDSTAASIFSVSSTGKIFTASEIEIDGALNHDGTTVGFYGVTPVVQSSAYTTSNVTTDRSYDADATTVNELADVLGTLIADLKATGIIG